MEKDNKLLYLIPSYDDVRGVVFELDANSASDVDGLSELFFQHCWEIIGINISDAVKFFQQFGCIQLGLYFNFMNLLPKVEDALTIDKFHSTMLNNFLFKTITKILSNRLALLAKMVVSLNQFGFIWGLHIQDCISMA